MKIKLLATILLSIIVFSSFPITIFASQNEDFYVDGYFQDHVSVSKSNTFMPSNDLLTNEDYLLEGYFVQQTVKDLCLGLSGYGVKARDGLKTETSKYVYDQLSLNISNVAQGKSNSTVFEIKSDSNHQLPFVTKSELGHDILIIKNGAYAINPLADKALQDKIATELRFNEVLNALLSDMPFELYWFNKTKGVQYSFGYNANMEKIFISDFTFSFSISESYMGSNELTMDSSQIARVNSACKNAANIVKSNEHLGDFPKLDEYRKEICELVSYDKAATATGYPYNDSFQLINVFDGDTNTNVVCEGYAKAFKYLCDLSSFRSDIVCYTVCGYLTGKDGSEGHMWNVLDMGGRNYLADITNCDTGGIGADKKLFLVGIAPDKNGTYTFMIDLLNRVSYTYYEDENGRYGEGYLDLFDASKEILPSVTSKNSVVQSYYTGKAIELSKSEILVKCDGMTDYISLKDLYSYNSVIFECFDVIWKNKSDGTLISTLSDNRGDYFNYFSGPTDIGNYICTVIYTPIGKNPVEMKSFEVEIVEPPAHTHDFDTEWKHDDINHWHECACGEKDSISAHTYDSGIITKSPSCTETGIKTYTCTVCGHTKVEVLPKLEHSYGDWTPHNEHQHKHTCACGDVQYENHSFDSGKVTKPASEEETGIKTYTCKDCGYIKTEIIPKLAHTHKFGTEWKQDDINHWHECACGEKDSVSAHTYDKGKITKAPSCTETGIKTYTCTVCGHTNTEVLPKLEHTYGDWTLHNEKQHKHTCACGDVQYENHHFDEGKITKPATEEEAGIKTYTCKDCGYIKIETIPQLNHTHKFGTDWKHDDINHWHECACGEKDSISAHTYDGGKVTKTPSCTETGIKTYTCSVCGHTKTEVLPKLDHSYGDWVSDNEKQHKHTCACGDTEYEDHNFDEGKVTKKPTHTESGEKTFTCKDCGYTKTETFPKLPEHHYGEWTEVDDKTHKRTCECGAEEVENHSFNSEGVCDKCGAKKKVIVPDINDSKTPGDNEFNAIISSSDDNLKNAVLSDDEIKMLENGTKIKISIEVKNINSSVTEEDKKLILGVIGDYKLGKYFDLNLLKKIESNDAEKVSITNGKVKITFVIPNDLLISSNESERNYAIIRVHDGKAELLNGDFNGENNEFTFETDRFSTYALVYNAIEKETSPSEEITDKEQSTTTIETKTPEVNTTVEETKVNTSDNNSDKNIVIISFSVIGVLIVAACVVSLVVIKKKKNK